ncbi:MAG: hypothetical protein AAFZ07_03460 [Actinomycetota bacterium]
MSGPLLVATGAPAGAQDVACDPEAVTITSGTLFTPGNGDSQTDWIPVDWPAGSVISASITTADPGHLTARDANEPQINETITIRFALSGGGIIATTPTPDLPIELTEDGPFSFSLIAPADIVRVRMSHGWYVNGIQGDLTNSIQGTAQVSCGGEVSTTTTTSEPTTTTTTVPPTLTEPPPPIDPSTTTTEATTTTTEATTTTTTTTTTTEPTTIATEPQETTTTAPPGTGGGELPRTGPNDGIIRIGLLLAGAGAALLLVERVGFGEPATVRAELDD